MTDVQEGKPRVGLFVTCLVDLQRPSVGFAAVKLLELAGCEVEVPSRQTCCGQPAFNNGDYASTAALARQTIEALESYDYVVAPSGSCAGTLKCHYPELLADDPDWAGRALAFSAKVHELLSFLVDVRALDVAKLDASFVGTATYHDSCSGLRELGIKEQPRKLLQAVEGLDVAEMEETEVCCGFGGTFCVKYPEISARMGSDKLRHAAETGADVLLGGDLGCLLNLSGRARRQGMDLRVFHTAEVLAGLAERGIGEEAK
ncbi:MAG: (Fe-S)-binding protein [Granulosicoccaceae bacterium]